jgi:twitching motility protein PilT
LTAAERGAGAQHAPYRRSRETIDRIIDVFPANQQQQIRVQLSMVLRAVVSQQLLPTVEGDWNPFEIMLATARFKHDS